MKFGICSYTEESAEVMLAACEQQGVEIVLIDLMQDNWLEKCQDESIDGFLLRPPCNYQEHKQIYDERSYVITRLLCKPTYPSFDELYVYENKRNMHTWCQVFDLPHVVTHVLTNYKQACQYFDQEKFPIVLKSNIGAGGSSVEIIQKRSQAKKIAGKIFGRFHPELSIGHFPFGVKKNIPFPRLGRTQRHYMICQPFVKIKWEWRIIRIGNSYFGHQKLLGNNAKASGSLLVGWEKPPIELLDLVRQFTEKSEFKTVALDIFEEASGKFSVNEIQPIIGAYAPSQMYINGIPGRYLYKDGDFIFDEGEYCKNQCWDLRVEDFLRQLAKGGV